MKNLIDFINYTCLKVRPVACCCGHGKYPMTIVVKDVYGNVWDAVSFKTIPRKKRFYKRDKEGYYYIPETIN